MTVEFSFMISVLAGGVGWKSGSGSGICSVGQRAAKWHSVCSGRGGVERWCHQYPAASHSLRGGAQGGATETSGRNTLLIAGIWEKFFLFPLFMFYFYNSFISLQVCLSFSFVISL